MGGHFLFATFAMIEKELELITEGSVSAYTPKIKIEGVSKTFVQSGRRLPVLRDINFTARDGEFVSIIGPSGCGKSTLLNIVAGLDAPSEGTIHIEGIRSKDRLGAVGYMQQKDLLLPWRNVMDNAILALEIRGESRSTARSRAKELIEQFGLQGFENEYPSALSGGMRQRVSFLRTVLADQEVFLLDEPFGALDALNRAQMHEWLQIQWERVKKTVLLVTHDVEEAIFLSDRVLVMSPRPGRITQIDNVPLPRPRTQDMVTLPEFVSLKAALLSAIRRETPERDGESR